MKAAQSTDQSQVIHEQVSLGFDRLTLLMQQLTRPHFIEHCRIWLAERGVKKLIQLALDGERLLGR